MYNYADSAPSIYMIKRNNIKLVSKYLLPTLKESQIPDKLNGSKSAELLERAGYIRKVNIFLKKVPSFCIICLSFSPQRGYTIFCH